MAETITSAQASSGPAGPAPRLASSQPPAIPLGAKIRQYEIIRELGRGGMGQVFLARDTKLARRVAMKFLTTVSGDQTERFLVEARTTARCTHENIVVIHEVDEHEGIPFMVLEYLEGTPLRAVMEGKRLSTSRAVEIMVPVLRALVCAHEFGIVHRDLKPENIFVTNSGTIKVLDFGIAKSLDVSEETRAAALHRTLDGETSHELTKQGVLLGTLPYMSPEQVGADLVDHRSDLWAIGIMLFELVAGKHPLAPLVVTKLMHDLLHLDQPMPRVGVELTDLPERFERVVDRCLAKRKAARYPGARDVLVELEGLLSGRLGRELTDDESPYPGLTAFQEDDADRFFGRAHDVVRTVARLRDQPLVGIVGPSGVGKSSFVRAGIAPALKTSGERWEVHIVRPGRNPFASLASILQTLITTGGTAQGSNKATVDHEALVARLTSEPGCLGTLLRTRAANKDTKLLLFIDQFEELYTLVADLDQRRAFTACLSGAADDASAPLRIIVSIRSDFLDRVGEDPRFFDDLTRGLVFLQPLGRQGLQEALTQPLEMRGYAFETPEMIEQMLAALATTPGALPLLQFAASRQWETRDRRRKLLTQAGHDAMGGISGVLSNHADQVLGALAPPSQRLARLVFQRLVTPERTRAIIDLDDLRGLSSSPRGAKEIDTRGVDAIIDTLVQARLLVVQGVGDSEGGTVEIVHESLITGWPTLRRWLDESQEDSAYLAQLRTAAKQWDQKARPAGLLWRGEALDEARHFRARYRGDLAEREDAFLKAVLALGTRATRIRRILLGGTIIVLSLLVAGGAVALISIRHAKSEAQDHAALAETEKAHAQQQAERAQTETEKARKAESQVQAQLDQIKTEQAARVQAETQARTFGDQAVMSKEQLEVALLKAKQDKLLAEREADKARKAELRAEQAARDEKATREAAESVYQKEKARAKLFEERGKAITNKLR